MVLTLCKSCHVFQDLRAYVCTTGSEECDGMLFADRDTWFEHEMSVHTATYACVICDTPPLLPLSKFEAHVSSVHSILEQRRLQLLKDAGKQLRRSLDARDCPFCKDWAEEISTSPPSQSPVTISPALFKHHVAIHQERVASWAITSKDEKQEVNPKIPLIEWKPYKKVNASRNDRGHDRAQKGESGGASTMAPALCWRCVSTTSIVIPSQLTIGNTHSAYAESHGFGPRLMSYVLNAPMLGVIIAWCGGRSLFLKVSNDWACSGRGIITLSPAIRILSV